LIINKKTMDIEKEPVEVTINKGGPIHVKGHFAFKDSSGHTEIKEHDLYLCRCGGSSNKPFCDSTHRKIGIKE
jgi:CDGSH-type Zn-finger protein